MCMAPSKRACTDVHSALSSSAVAAFAPSFTTSQQRKTFGVELDGAYRVVGRTEMPPLLRELGERVLECCLAEAWEYSRSDVSAAGPFEQAYVQRYMPGERSATLGFHFDSVRSFGELICGVTLCGSGTLLLSKTSGSEFIDVGAAAASERHLCTELAPLSVYAMSGLARYDLRHAVVAHGDGERISVTFRSVNWDRVRRAATT